jgi:hypothetical protein
MLHGARNTYVLSFNAVASISHSMRQVINISSGCKQYATLSVDMN